MRGMVLPLVALTQEPEMLLGAADVIFGRAPDPIVVRMVGGVDAHHAGDRFEGFGEWLRAVIPLMVPRASGFRLPFAD